MNKVLIAVMAIGISLGLSAAKWRDKTNYSRRISMNSHITADSGEKLRISVRKDGVLISSTSFTVPQGLSFYGDMNVYGELK